MTGLGFWIFAAVFMICETYMYSRGHDTFFLTHKTEAEKAIRDQQIAKRDQETAAYRKALERIASYPARREDERGPSTCRQIAREALEHGAQICDRKEES